MSLISASDPLAARIAPPDPSQCSESPSVAPTIIVAGSPWRFIDLVEFWRYRELLFFLVWRDVKVRYKQTVLGAAWVVLQPVAITVVFTLFFSRAAGVESSPVAYPLFALSGLLPWYFFSNAVSSAGQSLVANQSLVTKVYFPRIMVPMGAAAAGLVDFGISLSVLVVMMAYFGVVPGWGLLALPFVTLLLVLAAMGIGTLLAALTATYRDFRHLVPFMIQLWMFATPAIYLPKTDGAMQRWSWWLPLNPVQGLVLNFRAAALGLDFDYYALAVSGTVAILMALVGGIYFRRVERSFADII
jgi:lipopolysaccharide transport system permease protein